MPEEGSPPKLGLINLNLESRLDRLAEAIKPYFGLKPRTLKAMADAESYARLKEVDTDIEIARRKIEAIAEVSDLMERTGVRLAQQEMRRQANAESIVDMAAYQLPDAMTEESVEEDWIWRFFQYAQDVSNEDMQRLWAQILAGEVARPGRYSLRTLHFVSMLNAEDAALIEQVCPYVVVVEEGGGRRYGFLRLTASPFRSGSLPTLRLETIGFLAPGSQGMYYELEGGERSILSFGKHRYRVANVADRGSGVAVLTGIQALREPGLELSGLCANAPDRPKRLLKQWENSEYLEVTAIS